MLRDADIDRERPVLGKCVEIARLEETLVEDDRQPGLAADRAHRGEVADLDRFLDRPRKRRKRGEARYGGTGVRPEVVGVETERAASRQQVRAPAVAPRIAGQLELRVREPAPAEDQRLQHEDRRRGVAIDRGGMGARGQRIEAEHALDRNPVPAREEVEKGELDGAGGARIGVDLIVAGDPRGELGDGVDLRGEIGSAPVEVLKRGRGRLAGDVLARAALAEADQPVLVLDPDDHVFGDAPRRRGVPEGSLEGDRRGGDGDPPTRHAGP